MNEPTHPNVVELGLFCIRVIKNLVVAGIVTLGWSASGLAEHLGAPTIDYWQALGLVFTLAVLTNIAGSAWTRGANGAHEDNERSDKAREARANWERQQEGQARGRAKVGGL